MDSTSFTQLPVSGFPSGYLTASDWLSVQSILCLVSLPALPVWIAGSGLAPGALIGSPLTDDIWHAKAFASTDEVRNSPFRGRKL